MNLETAIHLLLSLREDQGKAIETRITTYDGEMDKTVKAVQVLVQVLAEKETREVTNAS